MQSKEKDGLIFIRLFPGEDIYPALKEACQKHSVETAVALICAASAGSRASLRFTKQEHPISP